MHSLGNAARPVTARDRSQVTVRYRSAPLTSPALAYAGVVLVLTLVAPVFATNCYVVAPAPGRECVIVDVGAGVADDVHAAVAAHDLTPVSVLATHGHVDHTWGAAEVCSHYDVPLRIHEADAYRLADPFGTLGGGQLVVALEQLGLLAADYRAPERIEPVSTDHRGQSRLELAELPWTWLHAPGHTQGASLLSVPRAPSSASDLLLGEGWPRELAPSRTVFSGDVLFAGTVGRTDLPGGDDAEMAATLADPVGTLAPDVLVLPGHGPATRMDVEYRRNPFLTPPDVL